MYLTRCLKRTYVCVFPTKGKHKRIRREFKIKTKYEDYTAHELVELFTQIWGLNCITEEKHSALVEHFLTITEHPDGLQLTVYIEAGIAKDPRDVIRIVNEWRLAHGKPGFKTQ
ncbi:MULTISPECIES: bacteriocin immunity protein [Pseudomonas]|uniref:Bacteriocin immunity protein n=1 Tax=Pseudomonas lundensis TaxID=86185 RepID=A0A266NC96_9PSED|nr:MULTISPECIES: bacteriocin immunity protein [Pseudomonas]NMY39394.1 bacteriocin immunity protein [Pseudomonas sp. WS 5078]NMY60914.1 bacteriocin immunity protein [Pseudomonas sp. WS 5354]NMY75767.1 bacteriocin immunity protein [Pseudomonas sp. WS 5071]OZY59642.1 hypothetical protein CJF39_09975 [Pseudomonas lundensis]